MKDAPDEAEGGLLESPVEAGLEKRIGVRFKEFIGDTSPKQKHFVSFMRHVLTEDQPVNEYQYLVDTLPALDHFHDGTLHHDKRVQKFLSSIRKKSMGQRPTTSQVSPNERLYKKNWEQFLQFLGKDPNRLGDNWCPSEDEVVSYFQDRIKSNKSVHTLRADYAKLNRTLRMGFGMSLQRCSRVAELFQSLPEDQGPTRESLTFTPEQIHRFLDMDFEDDNYWKVRQVVGIIGFCGQISTQNLRETKFSDFQDHPSGISLRFRSGAKIHNIVIPRNHPGLKSSMADKVQSYLKAFEYKEITKKFNDGAIKQVYVSKEFSANAMGRRILGQIPEDVAKLMGLPHSGGYTPLAFTSKRQSKTVRAEICDETPDNLDPLEIAEEGDAIQSDGDDKDEVLRGAKRPRVASCFSSDQFAQFLVSKALPEQYWLVRKAIAVISRARRLPMDEIIRMEVQDLRHWENLEEEERLIVGECLDAWDDGTRLKDEESIADGSPWVIGTEVARLLGLKYSEDFGHAHCFSGESSSMRMPLQDGQSQSGFTLNQIERFLRTQLDDPAWILRKALASIAYCSDLGLNDLEQIQRQDLALKFEGYNLTFNSEQSMSKRFLIPFQDCDPTTCMATCVRRFLRLWDSRILAHSAPLLFSKESLEQVLELADFNMGQVGPDVATLLGLSHPGSFRDQCFAQSSISLDSLDEITEELEAGMPKVPKDLLDKLRALEIHSLYWSVRKAILATSFILDLPLSDLRELEYIKVKDTPKEILLEVHGKSFEISKASPDALPMCEYLDMVNQRGLGGYVFKERISSSRWSARPLSRKALKSICDEAMTLVLLQELAPKEASSIEDDDIVKEEEDPEDVVEQVLEDTSLSLWEDNSDSVSNEDEPVKRDEDPPLLDMGGEEVDDPGIPLRFPKLEKAYKECNVKERTSVFYQNAWNRFVSKLAITQAPSPRDFVRYLRGLLENGTKANTVLTTFSMLNVVFKTKYGQRLQNFPEIQDFLQGVSNKERRLSHQNFTQDQITSVISNESLSNIFWLRAKAVLVLSQAGTIACSDWNKRLCALDFEDITIGSNCVEIKNNKPYVIQDPPSVALIQKYLEKIPSKWQQGPLFKQVSAKQQILKAKMTIKGLRAIAKEMALALGVDPKDYSHQSIFVHSHAQKSKKSNPFPVRVWKSLRSNTLKAIPEEETYIQYFKGLSRNMKSMNSVWYHFRVLRELHLSQFNLDIRRFSRLGDLIRDEFQKAQEFKKIFSLDEIQRFIGMKDIDLDPFWMVRKVAAVLGVCGHLHLLEIQVLRSSSCFRVDQGIAIRTKSSKFTDDSKSFVVPTDGESDTVSMAGVLHRYYERVPEEFKRESRFFLRSGTHEVFEKKYNTGVDKMLNMGQDVAQMLGLPDPDLYAHGQCFQLDPNQEPERLDAFFEGTKIPEETMREVVEHQPSLELPPLIKPDNPPKMEAVHEEELLKRIDSNGILTKSFGEPESSVQDYKNAWRQLLLHSRTDHPYEEHYKNFLHFLRHEKKWLASSIRNIFSRLTHYHKKLYGASIQEDYPKIIEAINDLLQADKEQGKSSPTKHFTLDEIEYFLRLDLPGMEWAMKKAAVCLIVAGQLSAREMHEINISDLFHTQDGFLINASGLHKSFVVPYNPSNPGFCMASTVKSYLDRVSDLSEGSCEGPFLKHVKKGDRMILDRRLALYLVSRICKDVAGVLLLPDPKFYLNNSFHTPRHLKKEPTMNQKYQKAWLTFTTWVGQEHPREEDYLRYFTHLKYYRQLKTSSLTSVYLQLSVGHQRYSGSRIQDWPSIRQLVKRDDVARLDPSRFKVFSMSEVQSLFAMDHLDEEPIWLMRKVAVAFALCGRLSLNEVVQIRLEHLKPSDFGILVEAREWNFLIPRNRLNPSFCMDSAVKKYVDHLRTLAPESSGAVLKKATDLGQLIDQPIPHNQALEIGQRVAEILGLPDPHLYSPKCFIPHGR